MIYLSLGLSGLWLLATRLIPVGPSRWHWPVVWALILTGVPLIGWLTYCHGPLAGVLGLVAGLGVLRLPVRALMQPPRTALPEGPRD